MIDYILVLLLQMLGVVFYCGSSFSAKAFLRSMTRPGPPIVSSKRMLMIVNICLNRSICTAISLEHLQFMLESSASMLVHACIPFPFCLPSNSTRHFAP